MKLLFVLGFTNPFAGAAWTRIGFFAETWSKQGHNIDVLGIFTPTKLRKRGAFKSNRVNIFNLIPNINLKHPFVFSLNNLLSFLVSSFFLIIERPAVVVISVPGNGTELGTLFACMIIGSRYVIDYRDEWEDYAISLSRSTGGKAFYFLVKRFASAIYSKSQLLTTVTPNCKFALEQRGMVNVKLIPNGADVTIFKPVFKKGNCKFKLLYSGSIDCYYRLEVVLKALKRFVDKGVNDALLIIVGAGSVDNILSMAIQLGVSGNVDFRGIIDEKTELANIIAEADVGLIPYDDNPLWKNALPAKFFEYCACGLTVIATVYDDSILGRLIKDKAIGVISPPLDDIKLAEAFYTLYNNKSFVESAGKKARTLVMEKFDRNKIAEEYLKLIKNN